MRERSHVPERATVLIAVAAPARIEVDVTETMSLQAGGAHRIGLRENILLIHHHAGGYNRLLAEGAPAKIGPSAYPIYLSKGSYGSEREGQHGNGDGNCNGSVPAVPFFGVLGQFVMTRAIGNARFCRECVHGWLLNFRSLLAGFLP